MSIFGQNLFISWKRRKSILTVDFVGMLVRVEIFFSFSTKSVRAGLAGASSKQFSIEEVVDPHTERRRCFVCVQVYKSLFQRMCIYNAGTDGDEFRNDVDN